MVKESTIKLASDIENAVNCYGNSEDMKYLVDEFAMMHKTLQQSFFGKYIMNIVRKMAVSYENGWTDGRNETAGKMAKVMWDGLVKEFPWMNVGENISLPLI